MLFFKNGRKWKSEKFEQFLLSYCYMFVDNWIPYDLMDML